MSGHRYLWTFVIVGGSFRRVTLAGNPTMTHDGTRSLMRCLCTEAEAEEIEALFKKAGASVEKNCPRETPEQTQERENLFAVFGDPANPVWPTPSCPSCAWFDPQVEGLCGAGKLSGRGFVGWGPEVRTERLTTDNFRRDYNNCPLSTGTT